VDDLAVVLKHPGRAARLVGVELAAVGQFAVDEDRHKLAWLVDVVFIFDGVCYDVYHKLHCSTHLLFCQLAVASKVIPCFYTQSTGFIVNSTL
jgi:hypothetical protein